MEPHDAAARPNVGRTAADRMTAADEVPEDLTRPTTRNEGELSSIHADYQDSHPNLSAVDGDFASSYAADPSLLRATFQITQAEARRFRIQSPSAGAPGRTRIPTHSIILRSISKHTTAPLTQEQTTRLLRALTSRDIAILQALHDYRYLTTLQIRQLFFPSLRSAQLRLQYLTNQGLLYSWRVIELPGLTRQSSLRLLTPRGARLLADIRGDLAIPYVQRAKEARDHCWHFTHDLQANGFFIDLIRASRLGLREGLLFWIGEESCRSNRRAWAKGKRRAVATPDGEGYYLCRGTLIRFDLEWDRGTESVSRLRQKVRTYVDYYRDVEGADRRNALFVLPNPHRENAVHRIIRRELPSFSYAMCPFWTTTIDRLEADGPLGPVWCDPDHEPGDLQKLAQLPRLRLTELPSSEESERTAKECIGLPGWWERRPGGGEVA